MTDSPIDVPKLQLINTIGFNGLIHGGLCIHPNRQHMIYALGCTVIVEDIQSRKQEFLSKHTDDVTCLAVSKHGNYIASGQKTHMGFKADMYVWDFASRTAICHFLLHKVNVEALTFSPNEKYLLSLGGKDCGSIVVWDMTSKSAICGSPAQVESAGNTLCVAYANKSDDLFVSGGNGTLRVWSLDVANRKIRPTDVRMGQLNRIVNCIQIAEDDDKFYCGTSTGDIVIINMNTKINQGFGPKKDMFSQGVSALTIIKQNELLVGAGDGTICLMRIEDTDGKKEGRFLRIKGKIAKVRGPVTSIALRGAGHQFYVGTATSQMYKFNASEFKHELTRTCHSSSINDISFPRGLGDLFATCSYEDIRIWNTTSGKELLRIVVPNMTCNAVDFAPDGKSIISGWDDGRVRAFAPTSGAEYYTMNDAHNLGVTAIAMTSCSQKVISGGGDGKVRVYDVSCQYIPKGTRTVTKLELTMKEHKASVTAIKLCKDDQSCVSASTDGTCIMWDLKSGIRNNIIFANTLFKCVNYHPQEYQIITSGTDRKIGYWEVSDGSMIRELEGAKNGSINGMDITSGDGLYFVTGGDDKLLKVWNYDEGDVKYVGQGHSGAITKLKISPNSQYIVSVSTDGACLVWKFPEDLRYN